MKKQKGSADDTDKAQAKTRVATPEKTETLRTEEPLAEKDEVKQAEEEQRKRIKLKNPGQ